MTLNFPPPSASPYTDPVSGLKYIYNSIVGAWEAAIQPPAVVSETAPSGVEIPGFLWWDSVSGTLYIYYKDVGDSSNGASSQWVEAVPQPSLVRNVLTGETPPTVANNGDLWWSSLNGRLYIYYSDVDGSQWLDASPNIAGVNEDTSGAAVTQGVNPPGSPKQSDLWFDTNSGNLYIYYSDSDSQQWIITNAYGENTTALALTAGNGVTITGTALAKTISLTNATSSIKGIVELASQAEVNAGVSSTHAVTPETLKTALTANPDNLVRAASATQKGIVELATNAEVATGTDTTKAVTPAGLASITSTGNPAGTIITFAAQTAPAGYVECDGRALNRSTNSALFAVLGTLHGTGDTVSTFNIPTIARIANNNIMYCIKT